MELHLERVLECTPEIAFALVSDPDRINLWSTAAVRCKATGDGGHPGAVGALREVALPGRRPRVLEETVEVSVPPSRFVYRVVGGAPVRSHTGEIVIVPEGSRARLAWTVRVRFPLPGMSVIARRQVEPALAESLDRMVEVAKRAEPGALPVVRSLYEEDALEALYEEAVALAEAQRVLADELRAARDPRAWITRAYQWLTEIGVAACRRGALQHPAWGLRLLLRLHRPYSDSLDRWLHREQGAPEDYWRAIFEEVASDAHRGRSQNESARGSIVRALGALIEEDLPRALASVWLHDYRHRCSFARFRADFYRLDVLFRELDRRLDATLRRGALGVRAATVLLPPAAREALHDKRVKRIVRKHREAFERGGRIARLLTDELRASS
jgi:hypothetical protein